ncbi:MAG: 3-phosphoshikimate 1-carboxyvinyltransferase [Gemmataceae bacterium]|nr:3-phosphoshikimate 1-carboxyvinyltransferase [Gemmataceae bacterium]
MDRLEIQPFTKPPHATVRVPGSKSITNRALVLAALCCRSWVAALQGCLRSEDTDLMVAALRSLGFEIGGWETGQGLVYVGRDSSELIPARSADLFVGNSGTTMRFLTALVSLGQGRYRLDGVARMRERPIEDLLSALRQLGVHAYSESDTGCPPVIIESNGWQQGKVRIRGDLSSQFVSGLLMAAPFAPQDTIIEMAGRPVSLPYIDMTVRMMRQWRLAVEPIDRARILVRGRQRSKPLREQMRVQTSESVPVYPIEPDASAASYFFAAAAISRGLVTVGNVAADSIQGDVRFIRVLNKMGCTVAQSADATTIMPGRPLRGIDVDMNDISDTVMTLGAVACFAEGPTTIRNVAHIRHKETDRLAALAAELRRVGAEVDEFPDGLKITPRPLHGAEIETYNDHRMAMSMALIGLKVPGIIIKNPGCVAKTYPGFWQDLEELRR